MNLFSVFKEGQETEIIFGLWGVSSDGILFTPSGKAIMRLPIQIAFWLHEQINKFANVGMRPNKAINPTRDNVGPDGITETPPKEEIMREEKLYISSKLVLALPMDNITFLTTVKKEDVDARHEIRAGYRVTYPDGYVSWSPKEAFENANREVTDTEKVFFYQAPKH